MIPKPDYASIGSRCWDVAPGIRLWCLGGDLRWMGDCMIARDYTPSHWQLGTDGRCGECAERDAHVAITRDQARAILEHLAESFADGLEGAA